MKSGGTGPAALSCAGTALALHLRKLHWSFHLQPRQDVIQFPSNPHWTILPPHITNHTFMQPLIQLKSSEMAHKRKGWDSPTSALTAFYEVQKNHPRIVLHWPVQCSGKNTQNPGRWLHSHVGWEQLQSLSLRYLRIPTANRIPPVPKG